MTEIIAGFFLLGLVLLPVFILLFACFNAWKALSQKDSKYYMAASVICAVGLLFGGSAAGYFLYAVYEPALNQEGGTNGMIILAVNIGVSIVSSIYYLFLLGLVHFLLKPKNKQRTELSKERIPPSF